MARPAALSRVCIVRRQDANTATDIGAQGLQAVMRDKVYDRARPELERTFVIPRTHYQYSRSLTQPEGVKIRP